MGDHVSDVPASAVDVGSSSATDATAGSDEFAVKVICIGDSAVGKSKALER